MPQTDTTETIEVTSRTRCAACCYCGQGRVFHEQNVPGKLVIDLGSDGWTMEIQEVRIGSESYDLIVYRCPRHPAPVRHERATTNEKVF
jgi:hypothetical protein